VYECVLIMRDTLGRKGAVYDILCEDIRCLKVCTNGGPNCMFKEYLGLSVSVC